LGGVHFNHSFVLVWFDYAPANSNKAMPFANYFAGTLSNMTKTPQKPSGRGGPGRGQGRSRIAAPEESTEYKLRMSTAQREKLGRLGGAPWLRAQIDAADASPKKAP